MEASEAIRANPDEEPYEGLLVILNDDRINCVNCGKVHRFLTSDEKPIAIRSDDGKAITLYGQVGTIVRIDEAAGAEVVVRDHRKDGDQKTDLFRVGVVTPRPAGNGVDGIKDPADETTSSSS